MKINSKYKTHNDPMIHPKPTKNQTIINWPLTCDTLSYKGNNPGYVPSSVPEYRQQIYQDSYKRPNS